MSFVGVSGSSSDIWGDAVDVDVDAAEVDGPDVNGADIDVAGADNPSVNVDGAAAGANIGGPAEPVVLPPVESCQ